MYVCVCLYICMHVYVFACVRMFVYLRHIKMVAEQLAAEEDRDEGGTT